MRNPVGRAARALALAAALASGSPGGWAQEPAARVIIVQRGAETMLASSLGAVSVVTTDGETLGDVTDTILSRDGRIVALIVGLGGFLGLAERPVAIGYGHLTARTGESGLEFVCDLDRAALAAAPTYRERD